MDCLLKDYKNTKQIMLKKLKNKENFWAAKQKFIKNYSPEDFNNKIFTNIPTFDNITNVINSFPNPLTNNITHITNFAGTLGSTLKNKIYSQLNFDGKDSKISFKAEERHKGESKLNQINK